MKVSEGINYRYSDTPSTFAANFDSPRAAARLAFAATTTSEASRFVSGDDDSAGNLLFQRFPFSVAD